MSYLERTDSKYLACVSRPIEAHGQFFPQAADGTILNPSSMDNVPELVQPLIDGVIAVYQQRLKGHLRSVYVRGSVVHGTSVKGFSDLDTFALVQPTDQQPFIWWCTPDWEAEASRKLLAYHDGWVTGIDFGYATWHEDLLKRHPNLAMVLKTQSLCVAGIDLKPLLPEFKPGLEMCCDYLALERELALLSAMVSGQVSLNAHKAQSAAKRLIRIAFELVMEREQRYTTSVYYCWDCFGRYYPQQREAARQVLEFYLNPEPNILAVAQCLSYGQWLKERVENYLQPMLADLASVEQ